MDCSELLGHFPSGSVRFDGPKFVRSKMMILSFGNNAMCIADIPMLLFSTLHGSTLWELVHRAKVKLEKIVISTSIEVFGAIFAVRKMNSTTLCKYIYEYNYGLSHIIIKCLK